MCPARLLTTIVLAVQLGASRATIRAADTSRGAFFLMKRVPSASFGDDLEYKGSLPGRQVHRVFLTVLTLISKSPNGDDVSQVIVSDTSADPGSS